MNSKYMSEYSFSSANRLKSSSSQRSNDYCRSINIENHSSYFTECKSFDIEDILNITNQHQSKLKTPYQLNDPYSLRNISEKDVNNVIEKWSYVRHDLNTFSMMLLRTLCDVCPETITKLKMEQGVPVLTGQGKLVIYKKDILEEAGKLMYYLDKILMNLDKPGNVYLLLNKIAGPNGFIESMLTVTDMMDLMIATLLAIEEYIPKRLSEDSRKSFFKVLFIIYSCIQDLTKWNDRSDIYKPIPAQI